MGGEQVYVSVLTPNLFAPWAELLVDALDPRPGSTVVDVACGPGTVARVAARRIGAIGHVYACDLSPTMLAAGSEMPPERGAAAIDYLACPADELPLPDERADAVTCQQGLQFFPDRVRALAEFRRVARPGARLAVSVWRAIDAMPIYAALVATAEQVLGGSDGLRDVPFSLADPAQLAELAGTAGWSRVEVSPRDLPIEFGSADDVLRCFAVTPVADAVRALDPAGHAELARVLRHHLEPFTDRDGAVRATTGTHFVTATA